MSMACRPEDHSIAVGTELTNHQASIYLWYGAEPLPSLP